MRLLRRGLMRRIILESEFMLRFVDVNVCSRSLIANFCSSIYGTLGGEPDFGNGDPDADIYAK